MSGAELLSGALTLSALFTLVFLVAGFAAFGWRVGARLFARLFGEDVAKIRQSLHFHNHPPPGYYTITTPEGFAILPKREPEEEEFDA